MASLLWALTRGATHRAATTFREVTPFTSLPGQAIAPTFSPDGSQIAFAWNGGEAAGHQFDLYVKSLGSERLLRLTHHPARWISPAWSPDGTVIAFLRDDSDTPGIYLIPALGGSERRLLTTRVAPGEFRQLSWSPDGKSLLYSGYQFSAEAQLFTLSLDSLSARPLLEPAPRCLDAAEPAFSANGQQLAFICITSSAVYSIDLVDLAHGRTHSLASILGYPQGLAWLADGRLVFSYDPGDGGELWQLSLNGQLTRFPFGEEASAPATDARAGRIAYVRGRNTVNIWRADLAAKDPQDSAVRLIYSTRSQFVPQYSPDGTHIVFQSNRSGSTEIWLADAQGADPERLTSFNGPVTDAPTWCSDGRRIAFDSRASGTSAIYIEDVHQKLPQKVSTSHENLMYPVFSQDCRWLFAKDGNNTLYRFPSSGGPAERVTEHFSPYATVLGDRLIFGVGKPNGVDLWSKPVKGGPESPLVNMPQLRYDDSWTATSSGIFYTDAGSYPVTLNFHDFSTGTNRTVMSLKRIPVPGSGPAMAASPDGRWLLYSQTDAEQSEIMLARDD
jgi:Tol biopolymer transport system component